MFNSIKINFVLLILLKSSDQMEADKFNLLFDFLASFTKVTNYIQELEIPSI